MDLTRVKLNACRIKDCDNPVKAGGLCRKHYDNWRYAVNSKYREKVVRYYRRANWLKDQSGEH
jgi:hypothetical protein